MSVGRWILILALTIPCFGQQPPRVATPAFIALNTASIGAASLDVALTRRCINAGTCHESNPLMQGSAGRQYAISLSMAVLGTFISYKLKQNGSRAWILTPMIGIGVHGVGAGVALRW